MLIKALTKANIEAIDLIRHTTKEISALRREKMRSVLANDMGYLIDMDYRYGFVLL